MILLFGAGGQVGRHLARVLPALRETRVLTRADVDLSHAPSVRAAIETSCPSVIVNAAAYTDVDRAESESALAHAVNATAPRVMAEEAVKCGALLVHYSTAFVFDGAATRPYLETDTTHPLGEYARSKLAGEEAIRAAGAQHLILRTNWVYDAHGRNFVTTLMKLALEREELRVVADQIGAPTWAKRIAEVTTALLKDEARARAAAGIYNLTALGRVDRYAFAKLLCEIAASRSGRSPARVLPIATAEYPTPAQRPLNSLLDNTKIVDTFGVTLNDWRDDLDACLAEMG